MADNLRNLCALRGVSGREHDVREHLQNSLSQAGIKSEADALGNLLVRRSGESTPKTALFAHMDEVGFFVRYITEEGFLRLSAAGGTEASAALGARVEVGEEFAYTSGRGREALNFIDAGARSSSGVAGVFGVKPVHLLSDSEKNTLPAKDALYIDIGAQSRADAERHVRLGGSVSFERRYTVTESGCIMSPALDDRAGCAVLLDLLLNTNLPFDAAFTVQEEVGARGAQTAAYALAPEVAIVLEATTAADLPNTRDGKRVCELGGGAAISFMDNGTVYDRELFELALSVAEEKGIPAQVKSLVAGATDAAAVHKSRAGVRTLTVSVPCRYIHSPCSVIDLRDLRAVRDLAAAVLEALV